MKNYFNCYGMLLVLVLILSSCEYFRNDSADLSLIPVRVGNNYEYINMEGKIQINPQFADATIFRNGLALIKTSGKNEKWGYISKDGKYAISPNYKYATVFNEGLAWTVLENGTPIAINKNGEIKINLQDAEVVKVFHQGMAAFAIQDSGSLKWGFVNSEGKIVITPQFTQTGSFSEGKCPIANSDRKWGFIDKDGKIVINFQFDGAKNFIGNKAVVSFENKVGVINNDGKYLINPQFSEIIDDGENFLISQDGKWGWCDTDGKILINPQFAAAFPFYSNDLAAVRTSENYGYIDRDGKISINPQFEVALPFLGKIAAVLNGRKVGFIDKEGKYFINPQFDGISNDIINSSQYEIVNTDYFNFNSIVNKVDFTHLQGLTLDSKMQDVMSKFNKIENDFSSYSEFYQMVSNQKITNDASMSFYIMSNPFKDVPDGWYTRRMFDKNVNINGFVYVINLFGKSYGKEKSVLDAFEKTLIGFSKISSNDNLRLYKNDKQFVMINYDGRNVSIGILKTPTTQSELNLLINFQNINFNLFSSMAIDSSSLHSFYR